MYCTVINPPNISYNKLIINSIKKINNFPILLPTNKKYSYICSRNMVIVEHRIVVPRVVGSNPIIHPESKNPHFLIEVRIF